MADTEQDKTDPATQRYAVIVTATGLVTDFVELTADEASNWTGAPGTSLQPADDTVVAGQVWNGTAFVDQNPAHHAVIRTADGRVVNVILIDLAANPDWSPGDGLTIHPTPDVGAVGQVWDGLKFIDPPSPAPTSADVDAERERRRYLPMSVTIAGATFQINMDKTAQANLQGLATVGLYLTQKGSSQTTQFRDYANQDHELAPADLVSLGLQVSARIQALYSASWTLKAMDPIPADYTADSYWP